MPVAPRLVLVLVLVLTPRVHAACARPDLRFAVPPDGAESVPLDARPSAYYEATADYLGEPVQLSSAAGELSVEITFDAVEHTLTIVPPALEPDTMYTLTWPELRGLGSASRGLGRTIAFRTGSAPDAEEPVFAGLSSVDWDIVHDRDACTDDFEDRFRFELALGDASDDGGRENLHLKLLQTRGAGAAAPRLVSALPFTDDRRVRVDLATGRARDQVCFAAIAVDLVARISASGHLERCVRTTEPPFFYGCALARAEDAGTLSWLVLALASLGRARRWRAAR
jgi:hypothetical protein